MTWWKKRSKWQEINLVRITTSQMKISNILTDDQIMKIVKIYSDIYGDICLTDSRSLEWHRYCKAGKFVFRYAHSFPIENIYIQNLSWRKSNIKPTTCLNRIQIVSAFIDVWWGLFVCNKNEHFTTEPPGENCLFMKFYLSLFLLFLLLFILGYSCIYSNYTNI